MSRTKYEFPKIVAPTDKELGMMKALRFPLLKAMLMPLTGTAKLDVVALPSGQKFFVSASKCIGLNAGEGYTQCGYARSSSSANNLCKRHEESYAKILQKKPKAAAAAADTDRETDDEDERFLNETFNKFAEIQVEKKVRKATKPPPLDREAAAAATATDTETELTADQAEKRAGKVRETVEYIENQLRVQQGKKK